TARPRAAVRCARIRKRQSTKAAAAPTTNRTSCVSRSEGDLMRRLFLALAAIAAMATVATLRAAPADALDAAKSAWQRGDYIAALNEYIQLLNGPNGDEFVEPIALTTGELYRTHEITSDGRAGRFSPDGRYIAYETGLETSRRTRILRNDGNRT